MTIKLRSLFIAIALLMIPSIVFLYVQKVQAVTINSANIPTGNQSHLDSNKRMCRLNSSSPVYLHGQQGWISSASSPTNISPINSSQGVDSVNLRWNVLSNNCTENMTPNNLSGVIANKAIQTTRYNFVSASSSIGSLSNFDSYKDTNYSNTYGTPNLYYVKESSNPTAVPVHDIFTLSGIGGLPPGLHTINVIIRTRAINSYKSGYHACVGGGVDPAANLSDTRCNPSNAGYSFQLKIIAPNQTVRGRVFKHPGQTGGGGLAGVGISYDGNNATAETTTDANGNYSFTRPQGSTYSVRIVSGQAQPSGTTGGPRIRPSGEDYGKPGGQHCPAFTASTTNPMVGGNNYCPQSTYEWQIAGQDSYTGCSNTAAFCYWDRASDSGFDFVYLAQGYNHVATHSVDGGDNDVEQGQLVKLEWNLCNSGNGVFYPENNSGNPANGPIRIRLESPEIQSGPRAGDKFELQDIDNNEPTSTYKGYSSGGTEITKAYDATYAEDARWEIRKNPGVPKAASGTETVCGGAPNGRGPGSATYKVPDSAEVGDEYCFRVEVYPKGGASGPPSTVTSNTERSEPDTCLTVVGKPYTRIYRGDISAGLPANCPGWTKASNALFTDASIFGFNKGTSGYGGAGVQFAAFAQATIDQFTSASGSAEAKPSSFSFANTIGANDPYGGGFASAPCPDNYYDDFVSSAVIKPVAATDSLDKILTDNGLSSSGYSGRNTVLVNRDLYIKDNVSYAAWTSLANLPSLQVIVRGNIYIAPNVTQLDGVFISQPDKAAVDASLAPGPLNGGYFITCADTTQSTRANLLSSTNPTYIAANCSNQLTIRGGVVAMGLRLYRTNGTLAKAANTDAYNSSNIAETFISTPASWLTPCTPSTCNSGPDKDSILGLPPVL